MGSSDFRSSYNRFYYYFASVIVSFRWSFWVRWKLLVGVRAIFCVWDLKIHSVWKKTLSFLTLKNSTSQVMKCLSTSLDFDSWGTQRPFFWMSHIAIERVETVEGWTIGAWLIFSSIRLESWLSYCIIYFEPFLNWRNLILTVQSVKVSSA